MGGILIGVAGWKRHHALQHTLNRLIEHTSSADVAEVAVAIDDPELHDYFRRQGYPWLLGTGVNMGVAGNKNRIFARFLDGSFDHLFLFEDDTFPIKDGWLHWWLDGHASTEVQALCWQPLDFYGGLSRTRGRSRGFEAISTKVDGMGLLSATRKAVETIGGMHHAFRDAPYGNEHSEWMTRANAAGLVPFTNCTLRGCEEWIDSLDYQSWRSADLSAEREPSGAETLFKKQQPRGLATFTRVRKTHRERARKPGGLFEDPHWPEVEARW